MMGFSKDEAEAHVRSAIENNSEKPSL